MKKIILSLLLVSCGALPNKQFETNSVTTFLDNWHQAASDANFKAYFDALDEQSIYIGTDATENWNKTEFAAFAKPYFDKRKAWNFKAVERHIYFSEDGKTAWFDELLQTQMKICRGSGILIQKKGEWKLKHYVLSMTIPNDTMNEVVAIKKTIEEGYLEKLKTKDISKN